MWVKKTKEEWKKEKGFVRRFLFSMDFEYVKIDPFLAALIVTVVLFVGIVVGEYLFGSIMLPFVWTSDNYSRVEWNEIPEHLDKYFALSGSFGGLTFILKMGKRLNGYTRMNYICEQCNNTQIYYKSRCNCGGKYIRVEKMKWVEGEAISQQIESGNENQ